MLFDRAALVAVAIGLATVVEAAPPRPAISESSVSIPVGQLEFYRNKDGLTFANAWGDPATGPHSNYIKLTGRSASPLHIHSSSYYGVVINGTISNERRGQPDQPLARGSYWFQNGGEPHVTKCLSSEDCLIFVTSPGKFDIYPVAEPTMPTGSAEHKP